MFRFQPGRYSARVSTPIVTTARAHRWAASRIRGATSWARARRSEVPARMKHRAALAFVAPDAGKAPVRTPRSSTRPITMRHPTTTTRVPATPENDSSNETTAGSNWRGWGSTRNAATREAKLEGSAAQREAMPWKNAIAARSGNRPGRARHHGDNFGSTLEQWYPIVHAAATRRTRYRACDALRLAVRWAREP